MPSVLSLSVLLILFLVATNGKRNFEIYLKNCTCTLNPIYGNVINCYVDKGSTPPLGHFDIQLHREITEPRYAFDVILIRSNQERYSLFNSYNNDGCAFLGGRLPTLIQIIRESIMKFGELPNKCPIPKDYHFMLKNFTLDAERFPAYMPEAKFVVQINVTERQEMVISFEANGEIIQTQKRWFG